MHKIQINYLYSSFVFVLITVYSFSSLTAEAGLISGAPYSTYNSGISYIKTNSNIHSHFLHYNAGQYQIICNVYEPDLSQPGCYTGKSYTIDLLPYCNEQKNNIPVKKNKNPFPHLLKLTDRPIKQDGKNR
jgi:hypothetical protein